MKEEDIAWVVIMMYTLKLAKVKRGEQLGR
jgi:hypothetical protein